MLRSCCLIVIVSTVLPAIYATTCPTNVLTVPASCTNNQYTTCLADETLETSTVTVGSCQKCNSTAQRRPGFLCRNGENTMCPAGYYCPLNATTNAYDYQLDCPKDHVCFTGFISPYKCNPGFHCPAGSKSIGISWSAAVSFAVAFLFFTCLLTCVWVTNRRELKRSQLAREQFDVDPDEALGVDFSDDTPAVEVEFKDVGMTLKKGGKCILKGVTGKFPPASLIALMGPSGGGKTTFMNALLGRANYANVTGTMKVNGVDGGFAKAKNRMGFVPQDDILHADLTVFQNLFFQAMLRLPAEKDEESKVKHVEQCIKILGISHIQDDLVGSPESRGISGGQKKRVNIGCELVAMPAIIFMDEPTSGLDGAATLELALCLQQLRQSGLTICCVIHQPRASVFNAFTHLLLLGKGGEQVYCGRTEFMERYLTLQKFRMPRGENAADWMIDVVCDLQPRYKFLEGEAAPPEGDAFDENFKAPEDLFTIWEDKYKAKCTDYSSEWMKDSPLNEHAELVELEPRFVPGRCRQFLTLLRRDYRKHDNKTFLTWSFALFICACLMSAIGSSDYNYNNIYTKTNSFGLFILILAVQMRSLFGDEQLTYFRECKTGISSFSYWLSKNIYAFVICWCFCLVWAVPTYYLSIPVCLFGDLYWTLFMVSWYWSGAAMFLSTAWSNQSSVTLALIMWNFLEVLFDGSAGDALIEIKDMNPVSWFLSCLTCGRWQRQLYFSYEVGQLPSHVRQFQAIHETEDNKEIPHDLDQGESEAQLYLLLLGFMFRALALLFLALIKYAEGGGFFADVKFVISSYLYDLCDCCAHEVGEDDDDTEAASPRNIAVPARKKLMSVPLAATKVTE